ncbi:hypothetical protein EIP86_004685 [Pleurotus ostreatoroseus]|nr:hypothetical protein EIP86_004685 [Pleurotus ostreatoroseus]
MLVLSRVQAFLPQIAASNADIARRAMEDPDSVDIEKVGADSRYIQMNLGLGVFEQRKGASRSFPTDSDAEMHDGEKSAASSYSGSSSSTRSGSEETDDSDSDSDESVDIISSFTEISSRPIKPLPRRRQPRPHIVVLGEGDSPASKRDSGSYSAGESQ